MSEEPAITENQLPDNWQEMITLLVQFSDRNELIKCAEQGYLAWLTNEAQSIPYSSDEIRAEFRRHSFTFAGASPYPFLSTVLDLLFDDVPIGYYELITGLDGTELDDFFVLRSDERS